MRHWTPEDVQKLKTLWAEGLSGSAIAKIFHVTRNSIIGKAHRLKLPARRVHSSSQNRVNGTKARKHKPRLSGWQRHPKPRPKPKVAPMEPLDAPVSLNVSLMDLGPGQCRYPQGDGPYVFCGHSAAEFEAYCEFHRRLCHEPINRRTQQHTNAYFTRRFAA